jgi:tRNA pseudouridine32 synthase/23S rRNA pseudouridine746 synthase
MSLPVLHLDEALIALDKPAGLLAVPGRGPANADCLAARVQAIHPEALVVHRLDMATSGLLLMARGPAMQRALSIAFAQRQVHKTYEAVVQGRPAEAAGDISLPLIADWPNRPRQKVDWALGKPSLTRWRLLAHDPARNRSRLALTPVTGRSHQLRVHLMAIGHAILGDELYAPPETATAAPRLLLHACRLQLPHPLDGRPVDLHCPVPF